MKTYSCASTLVSLLVLAGLAGCGGSDGGIPAAPPPSAGAAPPASPSQGPPTEVTFKVSDISGRALQGVFVVRGGGLTSATDPSGRITIRTPSGGESLWRLGGSSEELVGRELLLNLPASPFTQSAVMLRRETAHLLRAAEGGGTVIGKDGLSLSVAAGALAMGFGEPLIGDVLCYLTPIDPTHGEIAGAPAGFERSSADGSREPILSYGMAEIFVVNGLYDGPFVAPGRTATIEIPLYAAQHPSGQPVIAGERLGVAMIKELSGLWLDVGEGEVVAAAGSPTGLALRAIVTQFGQFSAFAFIGLRSVDVILVPPAGETLPNGSPYRVWGDVSSRGGPQAAFDYGSALLRDVSANGHFHSALLPFGPAFDVRAEVLVGTTTYFGTTQIAATPPNFSWVQLSLRRIEQLSPFITYPNGVASVKVGTIVSVKVEFSGPQPNRVQLFADQILIGELTGQRAFYTFEWDTTGLSPATRRLSAVAHDATSSGRSSEVQIVLGN